MDSSIILVLLLPIQSVRSWSAVYYMFRFGPRRLEIPSLSCSGSVICASNLELQYTLLRLYSTVIPKR